MAETPEAVVQDLAAERVLGSILDRVRRDWGGYDLIPHHQQGEFHHDLLVRVSNAKPRLPGQYLVISTNCNGGVKEVCASTSRWSHQRLRHAQSRFVCVYAKSFCAAEISAQQKDFVYKATLQRAAPPRALGDERGGA